MILTDILFHIYKVTSVVIIVLANKCITDFVCLSYYGNRSNIISIEKKKLLCFAI